MGPFPDSAFPSQGPGVKQGECEKQLIFPLRTAGSTAFEMRLAV